MELKRSFYQDPVFANAFFALQEVAFPGLDLAFALAECQLDKISIPYGLFDGKTAVSASSMQAVSILNATPVTVLFGDQHYQAVQIGTVATHPDWRGQGLSARLLKQVLADFQEKADFFFLFANETVVDFYPRFGFSRATEFQYERPLPSGANNLRQLDLRNPQDQSFLRDNLAQTMPISHQFGVVDYRVLRDFALHKFMPDAVWWDEKAELFLVAEVEEGRLTIYDLIGKQLPVTYLQTLCWPDAHTLETRFTPDLFAGDFQVIPYHADDDNLFILVNRDNNELSKALNRQFRVPALAKT